MADMIDSHQPVAKSSASEKKASKKSATTASDHPTYITMITEAIQTLKERNGSSRSAIKKYLHEKYGIVAETHKSYINSALKRGIEAGSLKQVGGSFKINHEHKNAVTTKAQGPKATKEAAKSPTKKSTVKKTDSAPKKVAKMPKTESKKNTPKKATDSTKKSGRPAKSASAKSPREPSVPKPKVSKKGAAAAH